MFRYLGLCIFVLVTGCSRTSANSPIDIAQPAERAVVPETVFAPEFVDSTGHKLRPLDDAATKALALIFILPDCPIANSFLPELNRLHDVFSPQGVKLLLVHADPDVTAEKARTHAAEYQIQSPVLLDPRHELVQKAAASISPEAVVFSPQGQIVYRGRINDQYVGLGKRRAAVTSHDLKNALTAILANKPVPQPRTHAIGCPIPTISTTK